MMEYNILGEIRLFAGEQAPYGWAFCKGQTLTTATYGALFVILGNRFGGNGTDNFQLPNLAPVKESDGGKSPVQYAICIQGPFPSRIDTRTEETGFMGQVRLFAGDFAPAGWRLCDGASVQVQSDRALYAVLFTQYGGIENLFFSLPKIASLKESDGGTTGINYIINVGGSYPSRA